MVWIKKIIGISQKIFGKGNNSRLTIGTNNQKNRESWLELNLKKIPEKSRILDAGAGELNYKKFCNHLKYVSQDFGQYTGVGNNRGLQMSVWDNSKIDIISDITSIPEPDASFDVIMCIEVFEHLPEPIKAIKEFSRLLRKNGILILTAPFCSLTHFAPFHFYSGFSRYFYETHLPVNGFEIREIVPNGNYFEYIGQEIRRLPSVSSDYSNFNEKELQNCTNKFLKILQKISDKEKESSDLLCFGFNVIATKV